MGVSRPPGSAERNGARPSDMEPSYECKQSARRSWVRDMASAGLVLDGRPRFTVAKPEFVLDHGARSGVGKSTLLPRARRAYMSHHPVSIVRFRRAASSRSSRRASSLVLSGTTPVRCLPWRKRPPRNVRAATRRFLGARRNDGQRVLRSARDGRARRSCRRPNPSSSRAECSNEYKLARALASASDGALDG